VAEESVDALFDQADLVFRGTVRQAGASTMTEVPATDRTAVVSVDEVLHAPTSLPGLEGSDITVALTEAEELAPGAQFLFFANAWLFGSSIAVQEVGRVAADQPGVAARAAAGVGDRARNTTRRELRRHVEDADIVITGQVAMVRPSPSAAARAREEGQPITEHDPQWQEAIVEVESVERGELGAKQVTVLFPASMDVMWRDAPKHRPGERGVWLLHREEVPRGVSEAVPDAFAVVHGDDFYGADRLDEILEVLQGTEGTEGGP
jgi:hypothetical protein